MSITGIDSYVINTGVIAGDIIFGDGDDVLYQTAQGDAYGGIAQFGNIVLSGDTIDFGGGQKQLHHRLCRYHADGRR